jgi:hypothetical protein
MSSRLLSVFQAVAVATLLTAAAVHADERKAFVIAAADGYGVEDCLAEAGECGKAVADAWCEAHGDGAALDFGAGAALAQKIGLDVGAARDGYVIVCGQ